ncbi:hypothetical protein [Fictibacillus macauensis]|uniref:hypothetical protein n=1 Tax=Fictibacillus macauensis TaxID=245160 RepID=UPI0003009DD0|nr:hypothetical protein [Fictibacillus macauensis]
MSREQDYIDKPENSSMTPSYEDMKEHGKIMENMETNKEIRKSGKQPDPIQEDGKPHKEK